MVTYDYECPVCLTVREFTVEYAERDDQSCPNCGMEGMHRLPAAPVLNTSACRMDSYYDETLGTVIHTERQRKYEMARKGLQDYEPDSDDRKITSEMKYARKHTKNEKDVKAFVSKASQEMTDSRRERMIEEKVDSALKAM